jgi:hypothetical protein
MTSGPLPLATQGAGERSGLARLAGSASWAETSWRAEASAAACYSCWAVRASEAARLVGRGGYARVAGPQRLLGWARR